MHKLIVLYPEPTDRAAFEAYYREVHLPLCAKLPGVQSISYSLGITPPGKGPYFGVFEASFADGAALGAAMSSPEGRAVEADVANYATGGATVITYPATAFPVG
ncbi:EthD family reductase [Leucobacter viscericola]|uniref:EthD family reductase n=1 Tax=Leucobacter viscericola TaxID=2714935 RepID=A0A6G7XDW3_9MICO|nr:EthD family reductase [Leucobacter viscericola]QIK62587.1 EthD family reductase [Leucobacter viscericola]